MLSIPLHTTLSEYTEYLMLLFRLFLPLLPIDIIEEAPMIKESFLRNYSLSKIYHQAEDQKNKLKVFYMRKVRKIMREKYDKERAAERQRLAQANKEERVKHRLRNQLNTEFCQPNTHPHFDESDRRSEIHGKQRAKEKVDISQIDLKFDFRLDCSFSLLKNERLKGLKTKSSINMLHSESACFEETQLERTRFLRKNTLKRFITSRNGENVCESPQGGCRSQEIRFRCQNMGGDKAAAAKYINRLKDNIGLNTIIPKQDEKAAHL